MSAIKKYFEHVREVEARNRILEKQREEKLKKIELEIIEPVPKDRRDYIDNVLYTRIHDEYIEDITWFLYSLDDYEIDYVLNKRLTYSANVQQAIHETFDPADFTRISTNSKLKIKYINDYELFKIQERRQQEYDKNLESEWEKYKFEHELFRPISEVDTKLQTLKTELEKLKTTLKNYPKKYVPPGVTRPVDQNLVNLETTIQKMENEIKLKNEEIKLLDKHWNEYEKRNFEYSH